MRIIILRKKIIVNLTILGVLLTIFSAIVFYHFHSISKVEEKVQKIKNDTSKIRVQTSDLQTKTIEIKKYSEIYEKLSENKKNTEGIKMDDVNTILKTVGNKYSIISPAIKVNLPDTLKDGIFNRATVTVSFTTANLTFSALNDVKAIGFISEFLESIPGFAIITNLEIKRGKPYTNQDFIEISTGKSKGGVSGKVDFFWYVAREKDDKKDETNKNSPPTQQPAPTPASKAIQPLEVENAPKPAL
jgi:hypothetical protein